jgi:hypothetical protein
MTVLVTVLDVTVFALIIVFCFVIGALLRILGRERRRW